MNESYILVNKNIVHLKNIIKIDYDDIENGNITLHIEDRYGYYELTTNGIESLMVLWKLNPRVLKGKKYIKWPKYAWWKHNLIGKPLMQILLFFHLYKEATYVHDITIPKPIGYKK